VIPTKSIYEDYSKELVSKIKNIDNCVADLDKNYSDTLNFRISKNKKSNKNVITIGISEVEHDTLMLHFNGTRPKTMELDDFTALLESYGNTNDEDENESGSESESDDSSTSTDDEPTINDLVKTNRKDNQVEKSKKSEKSEEDEEDNCLIM
jgi:hypothetical protein